MPKAKPAPAKRAKSSKVIRKYAADLLARYHVGEPPIRVADLAEELGVIVRLLPFEGELAGMLLRRGEQKIIGVNSLHHPNRQRFTIAHEIGHLVLHKGDVHIDKTFRVHRRDYTSSLAVEPDEIEANRFAAELLMPYEMVLEDLLVQDIDVENEVELKGLAQRYQVSVQSLTIRVTNLLGV